MLDGVTTLDPAAFPLYHVVNSDDVVPRMGGQMHLGALLVYQTTDELRKRCYAWPMDAESVRRRVLVSRAVAWMRDTPSSIEAMIAYLNVLREHDPEEIIAGLGLVEAKLPVRRLIAAADTRVDALLRYIARHLAAAYLSITGERLNPSRVAEIQTLLQALVDDMGVKAFSDALTQLTSQPHSITAKGGAAMSPTRTLSSMGWRSLCPPSGRRAVRRVCWSRAWRGRRRYVPSAGCTIAARRCRRVGRRARATSGCRARAARAAVCRRLRRGRCAPASR